ncbi:MAG: hypothetical protein LAN71_13490 [Acidobacteriia bacterium]|nr:hypothetical protein [Terriglobia bacterium]
MKRLIAFAGILIGAASLAILPGGTAGPAPQLSRTAHQIYPHNGAPSALYGYVTVEDKTKNLFYVGDPNTPANWAAGVPLEVDLGFQPLVRSGEKEYVLKFTHTFSAYSLPGGGSRGAAGRDGRNLLGSDPNALSYNIPFVTEQGGGAYPIYNQIEKKVYYDAKQWRFQWIEVPSLTWQETATTGVTAPVTVQLHAEDHPLREFPDPPGHGPRPY